jgi:hypothetical protein
MLKFGSEGRFENRTRESESLSFHHVSREESHDFLARGGVETPASDRLVLGRNGQWTECIIPKWKLRQIRPYPDWW